jgi:hypothetical protein
MAKKYYFPYILAKQREWAVNYKAKIEIEGPALGMSPTQIADEKALMDDIIKAIDNLISARKIAKQATQDKNIAINNSMKTMTVNIKDHKLADGYNEGIGELLGIIGEEKEFDPSKAKTTVKLKTVSTGVSIKFTLCGAEGGDIYCKRGKETEFSFYKYITHPSTIDTRANLEGQAEIRQYYVVLVKNDEEIGLKSDIATIKV